MIALDLATQRRNMRSLVDVPAGMIPDALLSWLLLRASLGEDVYAYRAAGENGPWNLWIDGRRVEIGAWVAEQRGA